MWQFTGEVRPGFSDLAGIGIHSGKIRLATDVDARIDIES
jgi:hypothetical protein